MEVDNMMKIAELKVKENDAPVGFTNLDKWNENYEKR